MRSFFRTLRTALGALRRNLMRSMLTCLGIVIGIATVIAMMEIGQGTSHAIRQTIATLGANLLQVEPGASSSSGVHSGAGTCLTLTPPGLRRHPPRVQSCPLGFPRRGLPHANHIR
jgi:hypothetical protein